MYNAVVGEIARYLTKEKIPTPSGKDVWQSSTITSILQNDKYNGAAIEKWFSYLRMV
jgi:hypothetical protein